MGERDNYLGDWAVPDWQGRSGRESMMRDFRISERDLEGCHILLAYYGSDGSWGGEAFVLFHNGNDLREVNGLHCSCYGLEGQWQPETTSVAALRKRRFGRLSGDLARAAQAVLDELDPEGSDAALDAWDIAHA